MNINVPDAGLLLEVGLNLVKLIGCSQQSPTPAKANNKQ